MECRIGCGACCIAPSISSHFPLHPNGKPAGERCKQLDDNNLCKLFATAQRPKVCFDFKACSWICGDSSEQALITLTELETATR